MGYWGFRPYVSVAQRRANAAREVAKLAKKGRVIAPVKLEGNKITSTFWGKAWCDNLESYSDFSNRLPRGRTYVRNGSVVDLHIAAGRVTALVSGSELYRIAIAIKSLRPSPWKALRTRCARQIGSLVELLQGRLSKGVMEIVTGREGGLFPKPSEIEMDCSCPDWAGMCKHVAAVLYGVGARLDQQPELLFTLRKVDHLELIAGADVPSMSADAETKTIDSTDLSDVFGIEIEGEGTPPGATATIEVRESDASGEPPCKSSRARKGIVRPQRKQASPDVKQRPPDVRFDRRRPDRMHKQQRSRRVAARTG